MLYRHILCCVYIMLYIYYVVQILGCTDIMLYRYYVVTLGWSYKLFCYCINIFIYFIEFIHMMVYNAHNYFKIYKIIERY